jgi:predicted DNA-binding transcriptional regulator AlpA
MSVQENPKLRIKEPEAARYIDMSASYLRLSRMGRADGPPFLKIGRAVRYDIRDLEAWLEKKRITC